MQTLTVDLGERSYPIYIGESLLAKPDLILKNLKGKQVFVVTNETVAPLYLEQIRNTLKGLHYSEIILPDGEQFKTLEILSQIFDKLLEDKHNRSTTLVALGGGVIGDITGFAASAYQRGVDFIQVPTTLLSQVDSSVGGKTGVNHPLGKNMIGAFHQPNCVIADTTTLNTLPDRELSAGVAEVIKYGLICDIDFYQWLHDNVDGLMQRQSAVLAEAIFRSCQNKAEVVAEDEHESGIRAILNFGHTFGHAIETAQGYGNWLHGEAVAAGMVLAAELSMQLGWISKTDVSTIIGVLNCAGLPVDPPDMTADQFMSLMMVDKKVIDGHLRLVLLKKVGEAVVTGDVTESQVRSALASQGVL